MEDDIRKRRQPTKAGRVFIDFENNQTTNRGLHLFYEGYDTVFYRKYILEIFETYQDNEVFEYNCGGKEAVYSVYNRIYSNSTLPHLVKLFFVDKDFDDLIEKQYVLVDDSPKCNLFTTRYYAIENYLFEGSNIPIITKYFFRNYLNVLDNNVLDIWSNRAISLITQFIYHEMAGLGAWIAHNRFMCERGRKEHSLSLQKVKLARYYSINDDFTISTKMDLTSIKADITDLKSNKNFTATNFDEDIIADYVNKIKAKGLELTRGKFLAQIYILFLKTYSEKQKTNISTDNILPILCPALTIPQDLKQFLENNYNKIQNG